MTQGQSLNNLSIKFLLNFGLGCICSEVFPPRAFFFFFLRCHQYIERCSFQPFFLFCRQHNVDTRETAYIYINVIANNMKSDNIC